MCRWCCSGAGCRSKSKRLHLPNNIMQGERELNSFNEILLNIKGQFYERVKSPFLFTFMLVITYLYWPIIFISIDSRLSSNEKICAIQAVINEPTGLSFLAIIGISILTMISFATLSTLGNFIGEAQSRISKEIRNRINVDYVNTKEYTATKEKLEEHSRTLADTIEKKDKAIRLLIVVSQFNEAEKVLFKKAIQNAGVLYKKYLSPEEIKLCDEIQIKAGVWGSNDTSYLVNGDVQRYAHVIFNIDGSINREA
jgi:hypothetical protein